MKHNKIIKNKLFDVKHKLNNILNKKCSEVFQNFNNVDFSINQMYWLLYDDITYITGELEKNIIDINFNESNT